MNMFWMNLDYSNYIFCFFLCSYPEPMTHSTPFEQVLHCQCVFAEKKDNAVLRVFVSHCERWKLCFSTENPPIILPSKRGPHFKSYELRGNLSLKGFIVEQLNTFPECCTSCEAQFTTATPNNSYPPTWIKRQRENYVMNQWKEV